MKGLSVSEVVQGFKRTIRAGIRDGMAVPEFFPDTRAPLPEELYALETYAFHHRKRDIFRSSIDFHKWYTVRKRQFLDYLQNVEVVDPNLSEEEE